MHLDEQFVIEAPAERVWPIISDPVQVAACFPGAELEDRTEDGTYRGRIAVRFGPTQATFRGQASFKFDHAGHYGAVTAQGRDRRGSTRASTTADVKLLADADSPQRSVVVIAGELEVSGPLSGFAEAGGIHVARLLFSDFGAEVARRAGDDTSPPGPAAGGDSRPALQPGIEQGLAAAPVSTADAVPSRGKPAEKSSTTSAEKSLSGLRLLRLLVSQWRRSRLTRRTRLRA